MEDSEYRDSPHGFNSAAALSPQKGPVGNLARLRIAGFNSAAALSPQKGNYGGPKKITAGRFNSAAALSPQKAPAAPAEPAAGDTLQFGCGFVAAEGLIAAGLIPADG